MIVGFNVVEPETIPGPVQLYVMPPIEEPARVVVVFAQVKVLVGPALTVGKGLTVTVIVLVDEQLVNVLVPVTV